MPRLLLVLVLGVGVFALPAAAAALGGMNPSGVVGGTATVRSCDDAVGVAYATSGGDVSSATVSGLADPGCSGARLRIAVTGSAGGSIATGGPVSVPSDPDTNDDSVTVPLSAGGRASDVAGAHVEIKES